MILASRDGAVLSEVPVSMIAGQPFLQAPDGASSHFTLKKKKYIKTNKTFA